MAELAHLMPLAELRANFQYKITHTEDILPYALDFTEYSKEGLCSILCNQIKYFNKISAILWAPFEAKKKKRKE